MQRFFQNVFKFNDNRVEKQDICLKKYWNGMKNGDLMLHSRQKGRQYTLNETKRKDFRTKVF